MPSASTTCSIMVCQSHRIEQPWLDKGGEAALPVVVEKGRPLEFWR